MKQKKKVHNSILKILGGTGYFTVFMEWFWMVALYLPAFFESDAGKTIFPKSEIQSEPFVATPVSPAEPSMLLTVLAIIAAVTVVILVIYVVLAKYIPTAAKVTTKVVHVAAEKAVPVVAHKPLEKIPARKRKLLTERVLFWAKLLAALVPLVIVVVTRISQKTVEAQIVILGFAFLAAAAFICFLFQTWLARKWRMSEDGQSR